MLTGFFFLLVDIKLTASLKLNQELSTGQRVKEKIAFLLSTSVENTVVLQSLHGLHLQYRGVYNQREGVTRRVFNHLSPTPRAECPSTAVMDLDSKSDREGA